jgi:hypothetical protein
MFAIVQRILEATAKNAKNVDLIKRGYQIN